MKRRFSALLVGVGGQGVITASTLLGQAADRAGLPTVLGQLHGMSQRGGSVECTVLLGPGESSFLIGAPDILAAFEPLEALRAKHRIGPGTHVVMSTSVIMPPPVIGGRAAYPDVPHIAEEIGAVAGGVTVVDGPALTAEVSEPRTLNVVMLGALAGLGLLPFDGAHLEGVVRQRLGGRFREQNERAFALGRQSVERKGASHG